MSRVSRKGCRIGLVVIVVAKPWPAGRPSQGPSYRRWVFSLVVPFLQNQLFGVALGLALAVAAKWVDAGRGGQRAPGIAFAAC